MHGMCIRCCARKEEAPDGDEGAAADAHVPLSCAPCAPFFHATDTAADI